MGTLRLPGSDSVKEERNWETAIGLLRPAPNPVRLRGCNMSIAQCGERCEGWSFLEKISESRKDSSFEFKDHVHSFTSLCEINRK